MLTVEMVKKVAPSGKDSIIEGVVKYFNIHGPKYGIDTYLRVCHWLAQSAHESAGFRTLEEYASGAAYEGRKDLGNTVKGDGVRFKGRGIFQLTGRANYTEMSKKLGVDLVKNPDLAETPEISVLTSLEYWKSRNITPLADKDDILNVSIKINGKNKKTGLPNGYEDRKLYLRRAKAAVPTNFSFEIKNDITEENDEIFAKHGDKGNVVREFQKLLNKNGANPKLIEDGDFGPKTGNAVKEFQKKNGLTVTGMIDTKTKEKLLG